MNPEFFFIVIFFIFIIIIILTANSSMTIQNGPIFEEQEIN